MRRTANPRMIAPAFSALFFLVSAAPAENREDLRGWGETHWNMTADEVKAAVPDAHDGRSGCELLGYRCSLVVNYTSILQVPFEISFQFAQDEDKLKIVHLRCLEHTAGTTDAYFERIEHALLEKYGPPRHQKDIKNGRDVNLERTWIVGHTRIELWHARSTKVISTDDVGLNYWDNALFVTDKL